MEREEGGVGVAPTSTGAEEEGEAVLRGVSKHVNKEGGEAVGVAVVKGMYPLHKAAFEGNVRELASLLRKEHVHDIAQKDIHGESV